MIIWRGCNRNYSLWNNLKGYLSKQPSPSTEVFHKVPLLPNPQIKRYSRSSKISMKQHPHLGAMKKYIHKCQANHFQHLKRKVIQAASQKLTRAWNFLDRFRTCSYNRANTRVKSSLNHEELRARLRTSSLLSQINVITLLIV